MSGFAFDGQAAPHRKRQKVTGHDVWLGLKGKATLDFSGMRSITLGRK
jgi:hypothetical protein